MADRAVSSKAAFDDFAGAYEEALNQGIAISGEDKNYFARGRIAWLKDCLARLGERPRTAMDFGCGTGSSVPFLFELLGVESVFGLEISTKSLEVAQQVHGSAHTHFLSFDQYQPSEQLDLAFCNGVFHHIPFGERPASLDYIYRSLRPGGLFALWENNPWNPGTRYVMSRIPFDRDAVTLSFLETRRLLQARGFEIRRTNFLFIFPRWLRWLRWIERLVCRLPLGSQYMVLARKPLAAGRTG